MHIRILTIVLLISINTLVSAQQNKEAPVTVKAVTTNNAGTMKLYPNPAKTYTNIYVDWSTAQPFTITIYDIQFNSQLTEIPVAVRKNYQYALDVSKLPDGKYKITVRGGTNVMEEILTVKK
jgi:hypothetical protein